MLKSWRSKLTVKWPLAIGYGSLPWFKSVQHPPEHFDDDDYDDDNSNKKNENTTLPMNSGTHPNPNAEGARFFNLHALRAI